MDDAVLEKCSALKHSQLVKVDWMRTPVAQARLHPAAYANTKACLNKKVDESCFVELQGRRTVGVCRDNFVQSTRVPQCIIAEVLEGPPSCFGKKPLDVCKMNFSTVYLDVTHNETHTGYCGDDSQATGVGCYTPRSAMFLHGIERQEQQPFKLLDAVVIVNGTRAWHRVGLRRHGGSSMCNALKAGSAKVPFYLDFQQSAFQAGKRDEFRPADEFPLCARRLVLKANQFIDRSQLRQFYGARLFERTGAHAPVSTFARVYVNDVYHGLYTMYQDVTVDELDATSALNPADSAAASLYTASLAQVKQTRISNKTGEASVQAHNLVFVVSRDAEANTAHVVQAADPDDEGAVPLDNLDDIACNRTPGTVYEPQCTLQYFQPSQFVPVEGMPTYPWILHPSLLHKALHDESRTLSPAAWRQRLEQVLNVREGPKSLLNWFATNVVAGNWDTYGSVTHNFKLYANPCSGQLSIYNDDLDSIMMTQSKDINLLYTSANARWPLVRYVLDDPEYQALYLGFVESALQQAFTEDIDKELLGLHKLISPYLYPDNEHGEDDDFTQTDYEAILPAVKSLAKDTKAHRQRLLKELKQLKAKKSKQEKAKKDEL